MATNEVERVHYYQQQFLGEKDFNAEQAYHREMRHRHNLGHHTWGIVVGLQLVQVPKEGQAPEVDVFVCPGLAVDGFGREILVLEPYRLDPADFKFFNKAETLQVWIAYDEEQTQRPAKGYELCTVEDLFTRVRETFRVVPEPGVDTHDSVIVDGKTVTETTATTGTGSCDKHVPADLSIPHQELPDDPDARWLVRLGSVEWDGVASFTTATETTLSAGRQYVGNVTAEVLAPDGKLILRDRLAPQPLPTDETDPDYDGVAAEVEGTLDVQRLLTAQQDAHVLGKVGIGTTSPAASLDIADVSVTSGGSDLGEDLWLRVGDGGDDGRIWAEYGKQAAPLLVLSDLDDPPRIQFQQTDSGDESAPDHASWIGHARGKSSDLAIMQGKVGIGTTTPDTTLHIAEGEDAKHAGESGYLVIGLVNGANLVLDNNEIMARNNGLKSTLHLQADGGDLVVHQNQSGTQFAVKDNGNVGIGTTSPNRPLTVEGSSGTYLNVRANGGTHEVLLGADNAGGIVSTMTNHDLQLRAGGNSTKMIVKADGDVGIGTTSPDRKLTLQGTSGTYLNVKGTNGTHEVLLGADSNGGIVSTMTNHDLQLRAGGNSTKVLVQADGDVGVGTTAPQSRLHVRDSLNESAVNLTDHVASVENSSTGTNADVLALKVGVGQPTNGNNFITFFGGANAVGAIEGNGAGGISLNTTSADYAEWLPRADESEHIQAGDIVGVSAGKVTRTTQGADHVLAISSAPLILGNRPAPEHEPHHEKVALLGQVPVRVRGPVRAGDCLVPSGRNDGTAVAVSSQSLTPLQLPQIVGRAWESSDDEGVKSVRTAVGLHSGLASAAVLRLLQDQQAELTNIRAELAALQTQVQALVTPVTA